MGPAPQRANNGIGRVVLVSGVVALIAGLVIGVGIQARAESDADFCSDHHKFGAQPVDIAKTADKQTVLAQASWGHHESIGCYLVLDGAATDALRVYESSPPKVRDILVNAYRCKTGVDVELVPDGCSGPYPDLHTDPDCVGAGYREPEFVGCIVTSEYSVNWVRSWRAVSYRMGHWERAVDGTIPVIGITCINDVLHVSVLWGESELRTSRYDPETRYYVEVGHQIDGGRNYYGDWEVFSDPGESYHTRPGEFLQRLEGSRSLKLTAWDEDGRRVGTAVFEMRGIDAEISEIRPLCRID